MKKLYILTLIVVASLSANAQVVSYDFYSYRLNNMFNVNPAYAGKGDGLNIIMNAQSQNRGVSYANKNYMLGAYSKISEKQALGGRLISDTRGAFQIIKADVSYAFSAKFSETASLKFGLNAGVLNNNLSVTRIDNYQSLDLSDPTLTTSYYNTTQFSAGAGLLFNYKGLDVSLSLPHIVMSSQAFNGYIHSAVFYAIPVSEKIKITPWVCYQNLPYTKNLVSGYVKGSYKDLIWVQTGYQSSNAFVANVGFNIENLSLGYGFTFSNKQFSNVTTGIHEVTFAFKINRRGAGAKDAFGAGSGTTLADILAQLNKLNDSNLSKDAMKDELGKIKQQLQKTSVENTSGNAEEVAKQLQQIDEKLKQIEKKVSNE